MRSSYIAALVGSAMATASPPHTVISVLTTVPMPRTRIENLPQPNELTDWITYVAGSSTSHMPGSNFLHLIVFIVDTRFQDLARERSRSDSFSGRVYHPPNFCHALAGELHSVRFLTRRVKNQNP